jgi:thioesterase domain-containing protein
MDTYLRSLWRAIPGSPDGDDFLVGGSSTVALVTLVVELQRSGFAISARDVVRHHTVPSLATVLARRHGVTSSEYPPFSDVWDAAPTRWAPSPVRSLVRLARGSGTPLFFVHNGLGFVRFLRPVVDRFRQGRPVYGFESAGIRDRRRPTLSIREMADRYLDELRAVQPRGPYHLVGICMGSHVAFEMAQRIRDDGDEVALLAIVNSYRSGVRQVPSGWGLEDLYRERIAYLQLLFGAYDLAADASRVVDSLRELRWLDDDADAADFFWHAAVCAANAFAQEHYDPRPYPGAVAVFQPQRTTNGERADWRPIAPAATTRYFDADTSLAVISTRQFAEAVAS